MQDSIVVPVVPVVAVATPEEIAAIKRNTLRLRNDVGIAIKGGYPVGQTLNLLPYYPLDASGAIGESVIRWPRRIV
jgi:hypothetical protein